MKRLFALVSSLALVAALAAPAVANSAQVQPLLAGQDMTAGTVTLSTDTSGNIFVEIDIDPGWCMTAAHVDQAASPSGFPTNSANNPKVGQFHYNLAYYTCQYWDRFQFRRAGGNLFAVHAVVERCGKFETAWGQGDDFDGKSWAMYIEYVGD
jgi:hypothetical protein